MNKLDRHILQCHVSCGSLLGCHGYHIIIKLAFIKLSVPFYIFRIKYHIGSCILEFDQY